jgi:CO/xanthine dehydrogenase FAD-binding subunit
MSVSWIEAFHRPQTIERVWQLLDEGGSTTRLVAGGTDLAIHCPPEVRTLVDLARVELNRIRRADDGAIRVGAMASLTEMLEDPLVTAHAGGVIATTLVHVGSPLLRNAATIGGHLARGRLSDIVPVCLALDARVSIYDGAYHQMSLDGYYRRQAHQARHILTDLVLPALPERSASVFLRFSRSAYDLALVAVACRVDLDGTSVSQARVAVGASYGPASLVPGAQTLLVGSTLDGAVIDEAGAIVEDVIDVDASWMVGEDYRRHVAATLVRRALTEIRDRLGGAT